MNIEVIKYLFENANPSEQIRIEYANKYTLCHIYQCDFHMNSIIIEKGNLLLAIECNYINSVWVTGNKNSKGMIKEQIKMSI